MHKLHRPPEPPALAAARARGESDWGAPSMGAARQEARGVLHEMQGSCCAYCEAKISLDSDRSHIDHLRRRADRPDLTLSWDNLFLSCNHQDHCAKLLRCAPNVRVSAYPLHVPCPWG